MHRCLASHIFRRSLVLGLCLLAPALAVGQQPAAPADPLAGVSMENLEREALGSRKKCDDLFTGKVALDPNDSEQSKAVDAAARYTLYRFRDVRSKETGWIDRTYQDFEDLQLRPILANRDKNMGVPELFTKLMVQHAKLVLQSPPTLREGPIARVNTARVLARLTKLGQPELADVLLETLAQEIQFDAKPLEESRNDGVKLYVLRGLGELLALQGAMGQPVLSKDREQKVVIALMKFIERKPPLEKGAPADEIEGARVLRREAIRALANGRLPTLETAEKQRPGLLLLRVVANDGLTPEPRMDERIEAAIGVARLSPERDKTYQPEYAAHQLIFFVQALGAYTNRGLKEEPLPLKVYAARLDDALDQMKTTSKSDAVNKAIVECLRVLVPIEADGKLTKAEAIDNLTKWELANPSKAESLYSDLKDATVKPANRSDSKEK